MRSCVPVNAEHVPLPWELRVDRKTVRQSGQGSGTGAGGGRRKLQISDFHFSFFNPKTRTERCPTLKIEK